MFVPYKFRLLILFAISFIVTMLVFKPILRIAKRKNIVDNPSARKLQKVPVPVMGGIAVFFGIVVGLCFYKTMIVYTALFPVLGAMTIMLYLGSIDDILNINPKVRFLIEIGVSLLLLYGIRCCICNFQGMWGIDTVSLWWGIPLSVITFVGVVNAINMIDGVDGLSSAFCILITGFLGIVCFLMHDFSLAALAAVCIGSLLPFFLHNVFGSSSKMFIGDGGTMMIGTVISSMIICILRKNADFVVVELPNFSRIAFVVAVLSIPVADTLRVMAVRVMQHRSPFSPDRNHTHHLLIKLNFSNIAITLIEIGQNLLVILAFLLSWKLGASMEWQLYITVLTAAAINWGQAYILNRKLKKENDAYINHLKKLGDHTHIERKGIWLKIQKLIDGNEAEMIEDED